MKFLKKIKPFVLCYFTIVISCLFLLFLVSKIPQNWLTENWSENRNTDIGDNIFDLVITNDYSTYLDNYTDNMKIDLAYRLNENSIITPTAYVKDWNHYVEYGRYWHGYCTVLRPLLLLFNYNQIIFLGALIILISLSILIYQLFKLKKYSLIVSIIISSLLTNLWVNLLRLQYFNCTLISIITSVLILKYQELYKKYKYILFFALGMLVCYFDFLTFESLTLSFPLLIGEFCINNDEKLIYKIFSIIKSCTLWATGYISMFISKWILYIFKTGKEGLDIISYKLSERTTGIDDVSYTIIETLKIVFERVRGISYDNFMVILILLIIYSIVTIYLIGGVKKYESIILLFIIGLIPIVRFIVLREHSASHSFFTYHALWTTVICYIYPIIHVLEYVITNLVLRRKSNENYKRKS